MKKILWNSKKPPLRYFWVPAGEDVYTGDFVIENSDGETAAVDLESVVAFEIEKDEAEALLMAELEGMTKELGDLFKGLLGLGKQIIASDLMDDDSDEDSDDDSDWDSDEDSDWDDSDEDSDEDSDDSDELAELNNLISLLGEDDSEDDSDEDSDEDSDDLGSLLEDLLTQFGNDLSEPMQELRGLISNEVGKLGIELDDIGSELAGELDKQPEAAQSILRELGQWLLKLADEQDAEEDEGNVVEFRPRTEEVEGSVDGSVEGSVEGSSESSTETVLLENTVEISAETDEEVLSEVEPVEETTSPTPTPTPTPTSTSTPSPTPTPSPTSSPEDEPETSSEVGSDTDEEEAASPTLPSATALKKMTKQQLVDLGAELGMELDLSDNKNTLLEKLETLR